MCPHTETRIVKQISASGAEQVFVQCLTCGQNVTREKTHRGAFLKKPSNSDNLPIVADYRERGGICEVCGAVGTETHHWAPRYLFDDDADKWPTAQLCPRCHAHWHRMVTPNMGGMQ